MGICNLINHGWTRIWFANAHRYYVMACAVMLGGLAIAAESISITATPRYPWNGKVDLKFTIDGTSGTKYDTSFTAKDVAGGTNLTMKTLYKSNGVAANVAKEQLLPGTYNWVWDATADLTSRWPSHASCVPTSSAVLLKDTQLAAIEDFYAVPCGTAVSDKSNRAKGRWIKTDGAGKSVQFAFSDDKYTKCVCVHFEQSGADVVGYAKWARYVDGLGHESEDFDANSATTQTIATSETAKGYGLCKMEARISQPNPSVVLDHVVVEGNTEKVLDINNATYMVVNLSSGTKTYLDAVPSGGWTDNHRKSLMVFRRVNKGTNAAGGSMTKDMWVGIFEVTRGQHAILTGNAANYEYGTISKHFTREDTCPTCIEAMDWAGGYTTTTATTKEDGSKNSGVSTMYPKAFTKFASISGLSGVRLPSWPEWQYAARAGTTTYYGNGTSTEAGLKLMACYNASATVKVGSYQPNGWGLYDMHGNADELLSLAKSGYAASAGGDCCSSAANCKSSSFLYWGFHSVGVVGFRIFIEIR